MTKYLALASAGILALIDQLIKNRVVDLMTLGGESITVIPGLLQLTYIHNTGGAYGLFAGNMKILAALTAVVIVAAVFLMLSGKVEHPLALWSLGLIIGGGVGNLIDRIFRVAVVDYLDVSPLFSFPVFNFADCCVVVGTILLIIYVVFIDGKRKPEQAEHEAESASGGEESVG